MREIDFFYLLSLWRSRPRMALNLLSILPGRTTSTAPTKPNDDDCVNFIFYVSRRTLSKRSFLGSLLQNICLESAFVFHDISHTKLFTSKKQNTLRRQWQGNQTKLQQLLTIIQKNTTTPIRPSQTRMFRVSDENPIKFRGQNFLLVAFRRERTHCCTVSPLLSIAKISLIHIRL